MKIFERYILGAAVPVMLIGAGVFFLIYLKFFFIVKPKRTFSPLFKKKKGNGVSSFGALTVALAGTLGVGNIVGVSSALIIGGPGSVIWMLISAFAAMVLKYAEILLAHRHRRFERGGISGGAMYYIEDYFGNGLGRVIATVFAVFCLVNTFSMGCMLQSNAVSAAFCQVADIQTWVIGAILAVLCGIVILKGVRDISPLTSVIIPIMTLVYISMSSLVIWQFRDNLGYVFSIMVKDAFAPESAFGGVCGFLLSDQVRYGTMRGLLSNEAGCGTAPMAHAASKAPKAAEQGIWGIIEVFVDTVLLCTLTALVILLAFGDRIGNFNDLDEMKLVIASFGTVFGNATEPMIFIMVFAFAFATIICWAYYGSVTLGYITQNTKIHSAFKLIYIAGVFVGAMQIGKAVWQMADIALAVMTIINITMLFFMRKEIKEETEYYL
ncbi:MAG: amino acid carrier protein [Clostridia bacterium]|nr:amino acid carrier protein [Clostridia bacterium]